MVNPIVDILRETKFKSNKMSFAYQCCKHNLVFETKIFPNIYLILKLLILRNKKNFIFTNRVHRQLVSVISTPFPWSPLKLHSNSTPWSGNGVEFQKSNGVGVTICGVGVGMEFEIIKI
jgi:hypothetical protein